MKPFILVAFTIFCYVAKAQDVSELFNALDSTVVTIEVKEFKLEQNQLSSASGLGSGVIISADGLILTAAHVVEFANEIIVKLNNEASYRADVISSSRFADVALLRLRNPPKNLKFAVLGDSDQSKIGEQILIIGAPLGLEHSLSVGHISRKMAKNLITNGEMAGFIQTDAAINHGNSGGPMFNFNGEVIGIVSFILSKSGGFEGLGFAADINTSKHMLFEVSSFWTGFDGVFLNEILAGVFNIPQQSGVLLQRVAPNSFADTIGLKGGFLQSEIMGEKLWLGGDVILSIQGISCNQPHDLNSIKDQIKNLQPGNTVIIEVLRKGEKMFLQANFTN